MQAMKLLLLIIYCINLTFGERCPVYLWGARTSAFPTLISVSQDKFTKDMEPLLASKGLVVFLEENLSTKDLSCKSCFTFLQSVEDGTYYGGVESAIHGLKSIAGESNYNFVNASDKLHEPLLTRAGIINFVKFDDNHQSTERDFSLKLHNSVIKNITSQLDENVFYIYTCAPSEFPLRRQIRQSTNEPKGFVFHDKDNFLLHFTTLSVIQGKSVTNLEIRNMNVKLANDTAMSVTLTTSGSPLTFDVTLAGGYFFMKNVMYDNIKFISSEVYAPIDFSYFCGNLTLTNLVNENVPPTTLKWNYLQFQAHFGHNKNTSFVFGDAWHCVGFVTGGILSGLLIVTLLLTITFIGICWMMDINTMDRFDDPKGKTITINASD